MTPCVLGGCCDVNLTIIKICIAINYICQPIQFTGIKILKIRYWDGGGGGGDMAILENGYRKHNFHEILLLF